MYISQEEKKRITAIYKTEQEMGAAIQQQPLDYNDMDELEARQRSTSSDYYDEGYLTKLSYNEIIRSCASEKTKNGCEAYRTIDQLLNCTLHPLYAALPRDDVFLATTFKISKCHACKSAQLLYSETNTNAYNICFECKRKYIELLDLKCGGGSSSDSDIEQVEQQLKNKVAVVLGNNTWLDVEIIMFLLRRGVLVHFLTGHEFDMHRLIMQPDYYIHCMRLRMIKLNVEKPPSYSNNFSIFPKSIDYLICNAMHDSDPGPSKEMCSSGRNGLYDSQNTKFLMGDSLYTQYQYLIPMDLAETMLSRKSKFGASWEVIGHTALTHAVMVVYDNNDASTNYISAASHPLKQFAETNANIYAKRNIMLNCVRLPYALTNEQFAAAAVLYPIISNEKSIGKTFEAATAIKYYDNVVMAAKQREVTIAAQDVMSE